ncbi:P-loop NTPase fold protein [Microbulbifer sp. ANSA002]|uniref:KAP family P-loop NTPase fold protein n=1 Tax=unclassified Microbulbifer TaxID=2619833 RepID=UPI0040428CCC
MSESDVVEQETISFPFRIKELDIANENWRPDSDRLKRCEEIENLTPILESVEAPLVLAIDSPWGGGKTTFIDLWQKYLKEKTDSKICLHLNAWENDFAEDPLLPLLSSFESWIAKESQLPKVKEAWEKLKKLTPAIIKGGVSILSKLATFGALDLSKEYEKAIADAVSGGTGTLVDQFQAQKSALKLFKEGLQEIISTLPDGQKNLIIFIDELDRCRPTFALELLERIKHLFDLKNVVFIVAVNREQLGKSIKGVYGGDFDGHTYLDRFFDIEYQLHTPMKNEYVKVACLKSDLTKLLSSKVWSTNLDYVCSILGWLSVQYDLTLRDINRLVSRLALIIRSSPNTNLAPIEVIIVFLVLRSKEKDLYWEILQGSCPVNKLVMRLINDDIENISRFIEPHHIATFIGTLFSLETSKSRYNESKSYWAQQHSEREHDSSLFGPLGRLLDMAENSVDVRFAWKVIETVANKVELLQKIEINK